MTDIKIGVQFYVTGYTVDAVTFATAAEDAGFESFWVPEHGVIPTKPSIAYPLTGGRIPDVYAQMADPFVLLSFAAAVTKKIKLGTGVCLVPEHHPLILAKTVATLDNFSGGRVLFGIGTGWLPEVTAYLNAHPDRPWRYTRETVEAMRALWSKGKAAYDGELVSFPEVYCDPRPAQQPHPPVIIGARPSDLALRRIAKWGDGWLAMDITPDELAERRKALMVECERIGRDPSEIEISVGVRDPSPRYQDAYGEAGADRLVVLLYGHPGTPLAMEDWADARLAGLTAPPPAPADTLRALEVTRDLAGL